MHSYLRAIGFSSIKSRTDLDKLFGLILSQPTDKKECEAEGKVRFAEISKEFADQLGVTIRGEYDDKGFFHLEHYFPYYNGFTNNVVREEIMINKRVDTEAYTGMCDDIRLGVSLIFYLQNVIDYRTLSRPIKGELFLAPVYLSGLSLEGRIILGLDIGQKSREKSIHEKKRRNQLIKEAKLGNQEAIDSLTIDDIDLYALISKRAKCEDIYSIVQSSFIPFGSESDNYSIIGTIVEFNLVQNSITKEELYLLLIECNDMYFSICINKEDLQGVPEVGRRFKGNIWMQGKIDFADL